MPGPLASTAFAQLFTDARSANAWTDRPVSSDLLKQLYDLVKMGPTSANCSPARFVFVTSDAAKARLKPCVAEGNVDKVMTAPVTVIIGQDMAFADHMEQLFPHNPVARHWFDDPAVRTETAFRNSTLQGAYLIMAARALGLDCGPMSGFDRKKLDAEFFAGTSVSANFLCALGTMDPAGLFDRSPRFNFSEAASIL